MKYTKLNNTTHIIEVPIQDFKIIMNDSKKKTAAPTNYCNAGFFANYSENNQPFTLPVAHLMCDYDATSITTKKYCTERGKFNGNKFTFDSSAWSYDNPCHNKPISTLLVNNNKAEIKEVVSVPTGYNYAISGIPIMKNGSSVNFELDVQSQGWSSSPLYGTWHIFIGLKKESDLIYIIGMQTTTWNMVKTNEVYKKFKELGMYDVIKLDGGGSFYINVDGKTLASTWEDRRINTIICFEDETDDASNETNNAKVKDNKDNKNNCGKNNVDKVSESVTNKTNDKATTITTTKTNKTNVVSLLNPFLKRMNKYAKFGNFRILSK